MTKDEMVKINYHQFRTAKEIEDILCLSVLIAKEILPVVANITDSIDYYESINGCDNCPCWETCLACIINE